MDGVVDPSPIIRARYEEELKALRERLGEPKTRRERWRFRREVLRLRKKFLKEFPQITNW